MQIVSVDDGSITMSISADDTSWEELRSASKHGDNDVLKLFDEFLEAEFAGVVLDDRMHIDIPSERYSVSSYFESDESPDHAAFLATTRELFDNESSGFLVGWASTPPRVTLGSLLQLLVDRDPEFGIAPEDLHLFTEDDLGEVPMIQVVARITAGAFVHEGLVPGHDRVSDAQRSGWDVFLVNTTDPRIIHLDGHALRVVSPR